MTEVRPKLVKEHIIPLRLDGLETTVTHMAKVRAYDPVVPGLIVHRSIGGAKGWTVSLREEGYSVASGFGKKDTALAFCAEVREWLDWTKAVERLLHEELALRVKTLQRRLIADEVAEALARREAKVAERERTKRMEQEWDRQ